LESKFFKNIPTNLVKTKPLSASLRVAPPLDPLPARYPQNHCGSKSKNEHKFKKLLKHYLIFANINLDVINANQIKRRGANLLVDLKINHEK